MGENCVARLQQQMVDASRDGKALDRDTITNLLEAVLDDRIPLTEFEDWLAGSASRLPTADEIIGVVDTLRRRMVPLHASVPAPIVDTCGTGGDGSGTFNISTATAIVVAAAGLPVAKHGNRAVSNKTGSADVFEHFGVRLDIPTYWSQIVWCKQAFAFVTHRLITLLWQKWVPCVVGLESQRCSTLLVHYVTQLTSQCR